jgi:hypothetical protein
VPAEVAETEVPADVPAEPELEGLEKTAEFEDGEQAEVELEIVQQSV